MSVLEQGYFDILRFLETKTKLQTYQNLFHILKSLWSENIKCTFKITLINSKMKTGKQFSYPLQMRLREAGVEYVFTASVHKKYTQEDVKVIMNK